MFKVTMQKLGDAAVLRCEGRMVIGVDDSMLRYALHAGRAKLLVLDLARVDRIDAAGLGGLLRLRQLASMKGTRLKLMNVRDQVRHVFELTRLHSAFEFCCVRDMVQLLCATVDSHSEPKDRRPEQGHELPPAAREDEVPLLVLQDSQRPLGALGQAGRQIVA